MGGGHSTWFGGRSRERDRRIVHSDRTQRLRMSESDPVRKRLREWRTALIERAGGERLHRFDPAGDGVLFLEEPTADEVFASLNSGGDPWRVWQPPRRRGRSKSQGPRRRDEVRLRPAAGESLPTCLARLHRRVRAAHEAGLTVLYMLVGTIRWGGRDGSPPLRAPVILLPVELRRESRRGPYALARGRGEARLNPALVLPGLCDHAPRLADPPRDWTSASAYLETLAASLAENGVEVGAEACFALFPAERLGLYEELTAIEEAALAHPLVRALAGEPSPDDAFGPWSTVAGLDELNPRESYSVLDANSGQRAVLEAVRERRPIVVVAGPPGTGKSQTIVNLLAEAVALGTSVLFVSGKVAALEVVRRRLSGAGLDGYCLALYSAKDARELARELDRAWRERPEATPAMEEPDFARLVELGAHLDRYARELHELVSPLERSIADVLGELATLHQAPRLHWIPADVDRLTPDVLEQTLALARRLSPVWRFAGDADFPWRRVISFEAGAKAREEWRGLLEEATRATEEFRSAAETLARSRGLPEPGSPAGASRLLESDVLLRQSQAVPRHWLTELDLGVARTEAETWRQVSDARRGCIAALRERFRPGFFELPEGFLHEMEAANRRIEVLLGREARSVLEARDGLEKWMRSTLRFLPRWEREAQALADALGLKDFKPSMESCVRIARLAQLLAGPEPPPWNWLDRRACARLAKVLDELDAAHAHYRATRRSILAEYKDTVMELDVDALIYRFSQLYKGALRWLRPQYYRDRALVRSLRIDGRFPNDPTGELRKARSLKQQATAFEPLRNKHRELLGPYATGPDVPLARARKALETAGSTLDLLANTSEFELLTSRLREGPLAGEFTATASKLAKSVGDNRTLRTGAEGALPQGAVPEHGEAIEHLPFDRLGRWLKETVDVMGDLAARLERVQGLTVAPEAGPLSLDDAIDALLERNSAYETEQRLAANAGRLQDLYGSLFQGNETDWSAVLGALERAVEIRRKLAEGALPRRLLDAPVHADSVSDHETCRRLEARVGELYEQLAQRFEQPRSTRRHPADAKDGWEAILWRLGDLRARLDDLEGWSEFCRVRQECDKMGLGPLLEELVARDVPAEALADAVRRSLLEAWYEHRKEEAPALRDFGSEGQESLLAEFRRLDRRLREDGSARVIAAAEAAMGADVAPPEELAAIKAALEGPPLSTHDLLGRAPRLLRRLKPIVMASPAGACALLPRDLAFDVAVFDEAVRIPTEEAVGCILRASRIVVFGDPQQLPPACGEDAHAPRGLFEELTELGAEVARLQWHCGSRHDALMAFSNTHFCGGGLAVPPSATRIDGSLGVHLELVEGETYDGDSKANQAEAERVAVFIEEHLRRSPDRSLGVVAFGEGQRRAIDQALDRLLESHPDLEALVRDDILEGLFVKEVSESQGDTRDVVILSLGCGRGADGAVEMEPGPLLGPAGGRYLNVALTRAREQLVLVSSVRAADIDPARASSEGLRLLSAYLDYAEWGQAAPPVRPERGSLLRRNVAEAVRAAGYRVAQSMGQGRLAVHLAVAHTSHPERFILALECDDDTEDARLTPRDRDLLRPEILERLGWRIHRVWSPDWAVRRAAEVERLLGALEEAGARQRVSEPVAAQSVAPTATVAEAASPAPGSPGAIEAPSAASGDEALVTAASEPAANEGPRAVPYEAAHVGPVKLPSRRLEDASNREAIVALLREVLEVEAPVHRDLAALRIVSACGARRGKRADEAIDLGIRTAEERGWLQRKGDFLYSVEKGDATSVRVPTTGDPASRRDAAHIPPDEVGRGARLLLLRTPRLERRELVTRLGQVFGFRRLPTQARKRFDEALSEVAAEGGLVLDGTAVCLPRPERPARRSPAGRSARAGEG